MNEINLIDEKEHVSFTKGSIWKDLDGELFILAEVDSGLFTMVSLVDGNRWSSPVENIREATLDHELVARNVKISIEILS